MKQYNIKLTDILLEYQKLDNILILILLDIGSHSELFK